MFSTVLIIDKRKELSLKYKRSIEDTEVSCVIANNLTDGIKMVQKLEPEMIIVSDSIEEELALFCKKIRALTFNTRPIIVAMSKSAESEDRINVLENGADDFISEPVNIEEFKTRIKAHLRRDIELNLDNKTLLPNRKIVLKTLKRVLLSENLGTLYIKIENLDLYKEAYTELASDKLVQTFLAIAKSALAENDFIGQTGESEFVIISSRWGLEKLANFITFAFDTVVPKFYSETDAARGYMLVKGSGSAGMRVNFVSVNIGGIVEGFNLISEPEILLNRLKDMANLAKVPSGSGYAIERAQITASDSVVENKKNNIICVMEKDNSLKYLIRTTLELQGYTVEEEPDMTCPEPPALLIIDSGNNLEELDYIKKLKSCQNFVNTVVIATSTVHDKNAVLDSGADLYLPKPYNITDLLKWVEHFMSKKQY